MFNKKYRDSCISRYENSRKQYEKTHSSMLEKASNLYVVRKDFKEIIDTSWSFLNSLRNKPSELDTQIKEIKLETSRFSQLEKIMYEKANSVDIKGKRSAAAGIAAGAGVAALGPTAAMGIAMTFGTASTGTAIISLSGAAATKAALAWLGGGALAAGGGGMAAGSAFLALLGPAGWAIGGASLLGAGIFSNSKNKKIAAEANRERAKVEAAMRASEGLIIEIDQIDSEIKAHSKSLPDLLNICEKSELDFSHMNEDEKNNIASLINLTQAGAKLLNKGIGENA